MSTENAVSLTPSSSIFDPDRSGPDRYDPKIEEEDWLEKLPGRAAKLPCDYWPHALCRRYHDESELLQALTREKPFGIPAPDVIDVINTYGAAAVEGALLRTLAYIGPAGIRKPRGWFFATLSKGKYWTTEQVRAYVLSQWEGALDQMARSGDSTYERFAERLSLESYRAHVRKPENVTPIKQRTRKAS